MMIKKSRNWCLVGIVLGSVVFFTAGFLLRRIPLEEDPATVTRSVEVRSLDEPAEDAIAIRFDRLRIPYGDFTPRESALAEIVEKARRTYFSGVFSRDIGWEQVSVDNTAKVESVDLKSTVSRIPVGQMSEVIDDGNAFHVLRVVSRSK